MDSHSRAVSRLQTDFPAIGEHFDARGLPFAARYRPPFRLMLLAELTDYFGVKTAELRSPVRGMVMMLNHTPPVSKGETLVTIGEWQ